MKLQEDEKKLFHTSSFKHFAFIFLKYITITFFKITISFRKYKRKVVVYLFNDDSSKSTFFMLNMEFDVLMQTTKSPAFCGRLTHFEDNCCLSPHVMNLYESPTLTTIYW